MHSCLVSVISVSASPKLEVCHVMAHRWRMEECWWISCSLAGCTGWRGRVGEWKAFYDVLVSVQTAGDMEMTSLVLNYSYRIEWRGCHRLSGGALMEVVPPCFYFSNQVFEGKKPRFELRVWFVVSNTIQTNQLIWKYGMITFLQGHFIIIVFIIIIIMPNRSCLFFIWNFHMEQN